MGEMNEANAAFNARHITGATIAWGGGRRYDFDNPNPEVISLEDAAYALAYTVRWRGQTRTLRRSWWHRAAGRPGRVARAFFGVAQHCTFGAEEMIREGHGPANALAFLFHEPDEVVLPDMPGPCKPRLLGFREFAQAQGNAILRRFDVRVPDSALCKRFDLRMMVTEKRDLMYGHEGVYFQTSRHEAVSDLEYAPFERKIVPYRHPDDAAQRWLELYHEFKRAV
jgi:hypothetical protein